jgi:hypothetical protein
MAWDSKRIVPWTQLMRPFALYFVVANVGMYAVARDKYGAGTFIGTVLGGVFYLAIGIVAVKFGWQPMTMARRREMAAARASAKSTRSSATSGADATPARRAPTPTRRTASGVGRQKR